MDVIEELNFGKIHKKKLGGSGGGGGGGGWWGGGGQGECERRIEVFVKIQKKKIWGGGGGSGGGGMGWVWGGVRVDVNEELKFLGKFTKKKFGGGWGQVGGGGVGFVGDQGGCERNVGGRGDVGYGGCEPRIGIVQCTKRYCTILRK